MANALVTVISAFAIGYDTNGDQGVTPTTWHYGDTISWIRGRHQIRGGAEFRRYDDNYYSRNRYRGALTIQSFADFLIGQSGNPVSQGGKGTGFSKINTEKVARGNPDGDHRIHHIGLIVP